jgi:hypothetical protein
MDWSFRAYCRLREEVIPSWANNREMVLAKTSGLDQGTLAKLAAASKGVFTAMEWLKKKQSVTGGYSLGLTNSERDVYDIASGLVDADHWKRIYMTYNGGNLNAATDQMLTKVAEAGKPVVFFVPDPRKGKGITTGELDWYIEKADSDPKMLANTYFVFGLYDLIDQKAFDDQVPGASWGGRDKEADIPTRQWKTDNITASVLDDPGAHMMKGPGGNEPTPDAGFNAVHEIPGLIKKGRPLAGKAPGKGLSQGVSGHN